MFRPLALALATLLPLAPAASAQTADERDPLLYVLEDDDSRVYLFGSIHLLDAGSYPLPDNVEAAYADAEALAFEIDMSNLAEIQQAVVARAQYADGRTLQEALGEERFAQLDSLSSTLGLPGAALASYEPWAVQLTLAGLGVQALGYNAQNGVDVHFTTRAQADAKPILALETADEQMAIFDEMPEAAQVAWLAEMLDGWDAQAATFERLIAAWRSGDAEALAALLNDMPADVRPALLRDRNARWVPQIEEMLAGSDDVLVVVGAGHLVGEDSVVAMLRAKGYALTRL